MIIINEFLFTFFLLCILYAYGNDVIGSSPTQFVKYLTDC
jgi:hypothetical protein